MSRYTALHLNQLFSSCLSNLTVRVKCVSNNDQGRVGSVILIDAASANSVSHCSSMVKVAVLNYTETQEGVCGGDGESLAPVTQHVVCLPGSFPPALIPDTARCQ